MSSSAEQKVTVNIREMKEEDIEGVLAIDRNITGSDRVLTYATDAESEMGGELGVSMVAEAGGEIVGFLLGQITDSFYRVGDTAWVRLIGVDSRYQRQGIGDRLLQGFTERCRQKGAESVHIMVRWHDWTLLSVLRSLGFDRGERTEFIKPII
ncbi:MAG: N-acetyltransferase [Dehalococcoidales bacterium]|nr:N-acetyltransferase [Dehalococcoidales bacterium]